MLNDMSLSALDEFVCMCLCSLVLLFYSLCNCISDGLLVVESVISKSITKTLVKLQMNLQVTKFES